MLTEYRNQLPDYAKDLKLNLSSVLATSGDGNLSEQQITGIALASAYATKSQQLIETITAYSKEIIDESMVQAAKAAASIMAMNNIYYRFIHLTSDKEYQSMPAKLRMNILANPGVEKVDFELYSIAVSAINGCGMCMDAHANTLTKHGLNKASVQHAIRIAAVINGLAQVSTIEQIH